MTILLRKLAIIMLLLALLVSSTCYNVLADELDRKPEITPHEAGVAPGDTFNLEVSVQAWVNSSYTIAFADRSRFSYPGPRSQTHVMAASDAILFKVQCAVEADTPDGDFFIAFKVSWEDNGTAQELEGQVRVIVGEGAGTDENQCTTSIMVASTALLAFPLLIVRRRGGRKDQG